MYQCNVRRYFICEESFLRPLMNTCVVFLFFFFFCFLFSLFLSSREDVRGNDKCRRSVGMRKHSFELFKMKCVVYLQLY